MGFQATDGKVLSRAGRFFVLRDGRGDEEVVTLAHPRDALGLQLSLWLLVTFAFVLAAARLGRSKPELV